MDIYTATMIAEGAFGAIDIDVTDDNIEDVQLEAWQTLIDTGVVWQLQGAFGRQAAHLIASGICSQAGE